MILRYTEENGGRTVYHVLRNTFAISESFVRRLRRTDGIRVNAVPVSTTLHLKPGDTLTVNVLAAERPCTVLPESGCIEILREDDGLLWVNKPCGMLTHPSHARLTGTLMNYVCGYEAKLNGLPHVHAVNRLDRDTSGVTLFAKNSYVKDQAERALSSANAGKEYFALVSPPPSDSSGVIDAPIRRERELDMRRIVSSDGQSAVTRYETLCIYPNNFALVHLHLDTGRTHQIRVHMLHIGSPLLGDRLYGTRASISLSALLGVETQALHAARLSFVHPLTGDFVIVDAPVRRQDLLGLVPELGSPALYDVLLNNGNTRNPC